MNRLRKIVDHIENIDGGDDVLQIKSCMNTYKNESVVLNSYPSGDVLPENFRIEKQIIDTLNDGDILVEIRCISIDAYLRTTMYKKSGLHESVKLNGKMRSIAVGRVIESKNINYREGDYVTGGFNVEKYSLIRKDVLDSNAIQKIKSPSNDVNDIRYYLTYLGIATGCSAYAGVYYASKAIKNGDVVVVNAASGAVGSIVCQLYRNKGAKVIAITGGQSKKRYLLQKLKLFQCIDYKTENIDDKLTEYAPNGVDIFFDNVGGEQLDIFMNHLNENAQIVLCGAISQYSNNLANDNVYGPKNYIKLIEKNAQMKGFTMFAYIHKLSQIRNDLLSMVKNETLIMKEVPIYGLNNFSTAISKLMKGDKNGKIVLYP